MLKSTEVKSGKVKLVCEQKGSVVEFLADKVLVAVGRRAYTDKLGLEKIGIEQDQRGRINIDANFQTNVPVFMQ